MLMVDYIVFFVYLSQSHFSKQVVVIGKLALDLLDLVSQLRNDAAQFAHQLLFGLVKLP